MNDTAHLSESNLARQGELSTAQQPTTLHETATTLEDSAKNSESVRDALLTCLGTLSHTPATAADDDARAATLGRLKKSVTTGLGGTAIAEDVEGQALTAEAALACLVELQTKWQVEMDDESLRQVLAYTDAGDGWTTEEAAAMAGQLVDAALPEHKVPSFIVESILQQHLRPLFSQSTTKVTASGRPVLFEQGEPRAYRGLETPSWKRGGLQIMSLFRWAVQHADDIVIRDHWPLFTPVLLTLIEDEDTAVRVHGLGTLGAFVDKCPLRILATTGIAKVFEESMFPSLLFLPTLTPEDQSVEIIKAAYKVLLILAKKDPDTKSSARRHLLDKMLRNGVFAAHDHASQYMRIVETLMTTLISVVDALEIFAVKHLQRPKQ
ncbi:uncharacterized protein F5Z01DRAFT_671154 [Emericellopsis atlantica]|uniref:Uncharacterized protein n=1 Tax=Emericellopsis atlantica TaxID=2614577 RepID=A0A9P7ZSL6_9HYPO|nr:uncharacterized protein F5Z01DRAFT_671154 [Emericellopsis atlantica]KAG9257559.1 hypothetical protein F5Z01DRAFT_671154 [Emericellopsis atlantica]